MTTNTLKTLFLLYHKHPTSAMTRFLRFSYGSVVGFEPLPELSQFTTLELDAVVMLHPAKLAAEAEEALGLERHTLIPQAEFRGAIETPEGIHPVMLLQFPDYDPPEEQLDSVGAHFILITQARSLAPVDLELLRSAYELILG